MTNARHDDGIVGAGQSVTNWIAEHAYPLSGTEAEPVFAELEPLRAAVGDATVVGIGGSTYGAHEQFTLTTAIIRFLVENMGFRAVATEEDWDVALGIDRYVCTGDGDLDELMRGAGMPWRTVELRSAVEWLRDYNVGRAEPVHFVGAGVIDTRAEVYDRVTAYVERVAPERAADLRASFEPIRPGGPDHVRWFFTEAADKPGLVEHARAALRLVEALPDDDREHALVVQHARQIVAFYEHYTYHVVDDGYRDRKMAENLRWWHEHTGARIAYWSTNAHSVRSDGVTIAIPPKDRLRFVPTGQHLANTYGARYVSIGLTFDRGSVVSGWGLPPFRRRTMAAPSNPADFAEAPLCEAGLDQYLLDLRTEAPPEVREWLDGPAKTRVIGSVCDPDTAGEEYWLSGGSPSSWFDVIVHNQVITPTTEL